LTVYAHHSFKMLDGMRGVAAMGVVLYHLSQMLSLHLFRAGYLAVDIFFCLSGFVIAHAYERRLLGGLSPLRFAAIRFARFFPLIALGIGWGAARPVPIE
jgi:peptidoglycan/LPS O-acetylase OafA/YrhL